MSNEACEDAVDGVRQICRSSSFTGEERNLVLYILFERPSGLSSGNIVDIKIMIVLVTLDGFED